MPITLDIPTKYTTRMDLQTSDVIRVRLEHKLRDTIRTLQNHEGLTIKGIRKPSRSLLMRRAISVYAAYVARLRTPEEIELESSALHKLA